MTAAETWGEVYCGECHRMREITRFSDEGPMTGALIPAHKLDVELACGHDHRECHVVPVSSIEKIRARIRAAAR